MLVPAGGHGNGGIRRRRGTARDLLGSDVLVDPRDRWHQPAARRGDGGKLPAMVCTAGGRRASASCCSVSINGTNGSGGAWAARAVTPGRSGMAVRAATEMRDAVQTGGKWR